jgi:hypothetical protein
MSMSMFEMDRKIRELEDAMTANDEYLQKVVALNAELLAALKRSVNWRGQDPVFHSYVVELIAKAEAFKS